MDKFRVWIRPLGSSCRIRVDGRQNADWLVSRLSRSFAFKSCEPMSEDGGSSNCTFRVPYTSDMPRQKLDRLMASIPEVTLMSDPA
jgi:hypothetical protein